MPGRDPFDIYPTVVAGALGEPLSFLVCLIGRRSWEFREATLLRAGFSPDESVDFADSFFCATGVDDEVYCMFCHLILRDWDDMDDPHLAHHNYSAHCIVSERWSHALNTCDRV